MTLTLACDHRILYGADAAQFLARIRELLRDALRAHAVSVERARRLRRAASRGEDVPQSPRR